MQVMLAVTLIALGLTGRADGFAAADGSKTNLNQLFTVNSSPAFLGCDYLGSDASHHCFVAKWKFARNDRFKVKTVDLVVKKPMPFGKGTVEVFPNNPTALEYEEFGRIVENKNELGGGKTLFRKK